MKFRLRLSAGLALLLISVVAAPIAAKEDSSVFAGKLQIGVELADQGAYQKAYTIFYGLFQHEKDPERRYVALFFACKSLERMGQYDRARELLGRYKEKAPETMRSDFVTLHREIENRLAYR